MSLLDRLIKIICSNVPIKKSEKWITNFRDATKVGWGGHGNSICVTCQKRMPICWDTTCFTCDDTSCYTHSVAVEGHWYCVKHDPSSELEFRQSFPPYHG